MRPTLLISVTVLLTAAAAFQFHWDRDNPTSDPKRGTSTAASAPVTFQPTSATGIVHCQANGGPHSIEGSVIQSATMAPGPVDVTLMRYELRGNRHVASAFVNVPLVGSTTFRVDGITAGLWVVAVRSVAEEHMGWGRSEPIWIDSEEPAGQVALSVKPYSAQVEVAGIPEHLRHRARITFEWTGTDRVHADSLEFLDPPIGRAHDGAYHDSFQLFGSLETVGTVWLVDPGVDEDVIPEDVPFDASDDPFGGQEVSRPRIALDAAGFATTALAGPGHVRAILHAEPGLWEALSVDIKLTRTQPTNAAVIQVPYVVGSEKAAGDLYGMHHPVSGAHTH